MRGVLDFSAISWGTTDERNAGQTHWNVHFSARAWLVNPNFAARDRRYPVSYPLPLSLRLPCRGARRWFSVPFGQKPEGGSSLGRRFERFAFCSFRLWFGSEAPATRKITRVHSRASNGGWRVLFLLHRISSDLHSSARFGMGRRLYERLWLGGWSCSVRITRKTRAGLDVQL